MFKILIKEPKACCYRLRLVRKSLDHQKTKQLSSKFKFIVLRKILIFLRYIKYLETQNERTTKLLEDKMKEFKLTQEIVKSQKQKMEENQENEKKNFGALGIELIQMKRNGETEKFEEIKNQNSDDFKEEL